MSVFDQIRKDLYDVEYAYFVILWEYDKRVHCDKIYWNNKHIHEYVNIGETEDDLDQVQEHVYEGIKNMVIVYPEHIQQFINNK